MTLNELVMFDIVGDNAQVVKKGSCPDKQVDFSGEDSVWFENAIHVCRFIQNILVEIENIGSFK